MNPSFLEYLLLMLLLTRLSHLSASTFINPVVCGRRAVASRKYSKGFMSSKADDLLMGKVEVPVKDAIICHSEPDVAFVDGSWWLASRETTSRYDFEKGPRISGAHFFDIDDIASKGDLNPQNLPHMMPPPELFATFMDAIKVSNDHHVIVYGQAGCPYLHRAWYQIICMGHDIKKVHLLAGSIEDWVEAGGPVDHEQISAIRADDLKVAIGSECSYRARPAQHVVDKSEIRRIIDKKDTNNLIVDVRAPERFFGEVDEPRPGLRVGHMPGAKNLFFMDLLDSEKPVKLKPHDELKRVISRAGLDINDSRTIISSCGSGATACTLAAALISCGRDPDLVAIYDGSWSEWGADPDVPITKD